MSPEAEAALHVAIAGLGGAAIGIERQWSGHATGPRARFGGIRTFTLLGLLAGAAGLCWALQAPELGAVLAAGGAAVVAGGYWKLHREDVEATTEVAALVVIAAGVLAGAGGGQGEPDPRAAAERRVGADGAAEPVHDPAADGQ
ncbi:MAG TPA: MgtC/SapB family protein, partial [Candidatus Eisenbacteria bacterium]|nr:MgtC/SapB family protein [Candidatus Eisenbacteria bacterium]